MLSTYDVAFVATQLGIKMNAKIIINRYNRKKIVVEINYKNNNFLYIITFYFLHHRIVSLHTVVQIYLLKRYVPDYNLQAPDIMTPILQNIFFYYLI